MNTQPIVKSILAVYAKASAETVSAGTDWYSEAESLVVSLSEISGYSQEHVAAVIAHLSPRTTWKRNIEGAIELLLNGKQMQGIMSSNFSRAKNALESNDPMSTLNGPKTKRFAMNILGDKKAVTVDVWAMRVAGIDEKLIAKAGMYDTVERAYVLAAKRVGIAPSEMQAITWCVIRNGRAA